jgi:hypothetical protein
MTSLDRAGSPSAIGTVSLASGLAALLALAGCASTTPQMGENKGVVSGSASGSANENANNALEKCSETLGTMAVQEDTAAPWYYQLRSHQLGSTVPVLRLMIQQSNCFVIVERGRTMNNMMQERNLQNSGEMRAESNFGKGQMVAADYTLSPEIQFSGKTGGGGGGIAGPGLLGIVGGIAGSVSRNEASTTLLLIDNRSGVQVSASEGTAKNYDIGAYGFSVAGLAAAGGGYSNTPQGKVVVAAFADSYNQMVKSLRNYKAQTVSGGLGKGGRLGVDGGTTPASKEISAPAPTAAKPVPKKKATTQ